jgi:hypothetical protein
MAVLQKFELSTKVAQKLKSRADDKSWAGTKSRAGAMSMWGGISAYLGRESPISPQVNCVIIFDPFSVEGVKPPICGAGTPKSSIKMGRE